MNDSYIYTIHLTHIFHPQVDQFMIHLRRSTYCYTTRRSPCIASRGASLPRRAPPLSAPRHQGGCHGDFQAGDFHAWWLTIITAGNGGENWWKRWKNAGYQVKAMIVYHSKQLKLVTHGENGEKQVQLQIVFMVNNGCCSCCSTMHNIKQFIVIER